ncbi:MAG TPA: PAS domain S-box protein, partial [Chloroflexia bacterium]|nr:PAS domain S-box protein [Chloroflexia bacterium]
MSRIPSLRLSAGTPGHRPANDAVSASQSRGAARFLAGRLPQLNLSLLSRFSIVSFVLLATLAVALGWGLQKKLEEGLLRTVSERAANTVVNVVAPRLRASDLEQPLSQARVEEIEGFLGQTVLDEHVVRVKIWSPSGRILYSDDRDLIGKQFPVDDEVVEALEGQVRMGVSNLEASENIGERGLYDRLLEIYVPLQVGNATRPGAVFEMYHDMAEIDRQYSDMQSFIWFSFGFGFLALYGSLFTLVSKASGDLTRRSRDNARLYREATAHLMELKQVEEALRKSEVYFRSLTENALDIVTVLNSDGTIRYESPSVKKVLGYDPLERLGKDAFTDVHPDDAQAVRAAFENLRLAPRSGAPLEFRFRRKDGGWSTMEALGQNLLEDPDVAGIVINSRDVSQRNHAEAALRESEQRFRAVFEGAAVGVALSDLDAHIVEWNPAFQEMLGYPADELRGKTFVQMTHPDDVSQNWNYFTELVEMKRQHYQMMKRYFRKDGAIIWVNLTVSLIRDA